jgi:hypothetical protein
VPLPDSAEPQRPNDSPSASPAPAASSRAADWPLVLPFYLAGAVLLVLAAGGLLLWLEAWPLRASVPDGVRRIGFEVALLLAAVSLAMFVWPRIITLRLRQIDTLAEVLAHIARHVTDLEAVRREMYRCRAAVEGVAQLHEAEREHFVEHRRFLLEHVNLAEDLQNTRLELSGLRRQLDRWCEAAGGYFAQFERLLDFDQSLGDDARRTAARLLESFVRSVAPLGVQLLRPEPNQPFDPRIHRVVGEEETAAVAAGHVLVCRRWGWQYGSEVKRPAEVVVGKGAMQPACPPREAPAARDDDTMGRDDETKR